MGFNSGFKGLKYSKRNLIQLPLCSPQIPHKLACDYKTAAAEPWLDR